MDSNWKNLPAKNLHFSVVTTFGVLSTLVVIYVGSTSEAQSIPDPMHCQLCLLSLIYILVATELLTKEFTQRSVASIPIFANESCESKE